MDKYGIRPGRGTTAYHAGPPGLQSLALGAWWPDQYGSTEPVRNQYGKDNPPGSFRALLTKIFNRWSSHVVKQLPPKH